MKGKSHYSSPQIVKVVAFRMRGEILSGSVVDKTAPIVSNGQEVVDIDAGSSSFDWNSNWDWE